MSRATTGTSAAHTDSVQASGVGLGVGVTGGGARWGAAAAAGEQRGRGEHEQYRNRPGRTTSHRCSPTP